MKKYHALSDLAAITLARHEEINAPPYPGQETVVLACDIFLAEALRKAEGQPNFIDIREKEKEE